MAELLIPAPVSVTSGTGDFVINAKTSISLSTQDPDVKRVAGFLSKKLSFVTGHAISFAGSKNTENSIRLSIINDASIGDEGYKLNVTPREISISANKAAGLYYGMQTLFQLMPKEVEEVAFTKDIKWEVPVCSITDYPRFAWRGLMFDVSRHFFTKDEVKEFIDQMVKYKYNIMHWHLTDDEGWRIEIKGLPKLTEVGAWNVKKVGYFGTFSPPTLDEPRNYGGFYTQDDINEIVQYAKDRFVNILPEIDVPGHSLAASCFLS